jgi:hypothetical protein
VPLDVKLYNVLFYEPKDTKTALKVATPILSAIEDRANARFTQVIIPELVRMGLINEQMPLAEFAAKARELPEPVVKKMGLPQREHFAFNVRPYEEAGGIPGTLEELAAMHQRLAPEGISVSFFNTAYTSEENDYAKLVDMIPELPALDRSTWIATTSLREPIPKVFKAKLSEKAGGGKLTGAGARRLTMLDGKPLLIPIGDSIVLRAKGECVDAVYDRLANCREQDYLTGA